MTRQAQLEQELHRITDIVVREYHPDRVILFGLGAVPVPAVPGYHNKH